MEQHSNHDDKRRAITSTDIVRAYEENPRISKAIACRLSEMTAEREQCDVFTLEYIVAEESARHAAGQTYSYDHYKEVGND
ncbi:hypothetical protein HF285_04715 [Acidithiobacillus ferrooxidans F221]|uniref:hypothetical protein n=1 Tax=Acidithiobacillus ferrooxidans TaxID=920 RepID=UPI001C0761C5|nr:hypothetical protein [Acidithiobacillus ferrooxidans]MBU2807584.1 hypothetical protein [Acidithiobacillus ferrooxidans F221]